MIIYWLEIETNNEESDIQQKIYIYISKIKELLQDATCADFRSLRAKLVCIANSRPDIYCPAEKLVQVVMKTSKKQENTTSIRSMI